MSAKRKASTIYTGWWGRRWGQGPEKAEVRATQEQSLKNKQNLKACRNTHSSNRNTEMRCRTKSHPLGKAHAAKLWHGVSGISVQFTSFSRWDAKPWGMQSQWTCFLSPGNPVWGSQPWRTERNQSRLSPSVPGPRKASGLTDKNPQAALLHREAPSTLLLRALEPEHKTYRNAQ